MAALGASLRATVIVLTYRRNDDLAELLPLLETQAATVPDVAVDVLVVDNDPDGGGRTLVGSASWPTLARYVHEPTPGIAAARNRALEETLDADVIVFIDDDERPYDPWLRSLLDTFRETGAAGVTGLVVPVYAAEPEPWITAGGFFVRENHPQGTEMPAAGTGNLLLDRHVVERLGLRFDESFSLTGGSDHVFTRSLVRGGGRIVWAADATVTDEVPTSRMTRTWVRRRAFRIGITWSRATLLFAPRGPGRLLSRLKLTARGGARAGAGGLRIALGVVTLSRRHRARGNRTAFRGLGMLAGAWGGALQEYRRSQAAPAEGTGGVGSP